MKRSRIVKSVEDGLPVAEAIRQHGVSRNTLYRWRRKYAGLEVPEAKRLKASRTRTGG